MKPKRTRNIILGAIIGSTLITQQAALGQSEWIGGVGSYSNAAGWDPTGAPANTTAIIIDSGTVTNSGNLSRRANTSIGGGNLVISGRFLGADGAASGVSISSGSIQHTGQYFIIGTGASGTFTQTGGTVTSRVDRGFFTSDGSGSTGSLTITDGSFSVQHNGSYNDLLHNTYVGRTGNNDSILVNGGSFSVTNTAALPVSGAGRRFLMGKNSSFEIESGSATIGGMEYVVVGTNRVVNTGTSTFEVNGGTLAANVTTALVVGGGANGSMSISGGTMDISKVDGNGGNLWLDSTVPNFTQGIPAHNTTSAIITQTAGILTVGGDIVIGRNGSAATAAYNMFGGELYANSLGIGTNTNAAFNFDGGDIFLTGDQTSVINQTWFNGVVGTTATFDGVNQTHIFVIPEPSAVMLLGVGAFALTLRRRRA